MLLKNTPYPVFNSVFRFTSFEPINLKTSPLKNITFLFLTAFSSLSLTAQNYIGHRIDNYSGIHGVMYNPVSVFDSRMRADINLISFGVSAGNDYAGLNLTQLGSGEDGFDFEEEVNQNPTDANNFYINTDVMGPSFMFNLSPKSSIGLITRVRGLFNINNISGTLYENITNDFDTEQDFDFAIENLSGTAHLFAEIGVAYGRQLFYNQQHFLKGGLTLKYLNGAGGLFVHSPNLSGNYNATQETLNTTGSFDYGTTVDFDNEDLNFESMASGLGADIGFIYEFRPDTTAISSRSQNKYKLKLDGDPVGGKSWGGDWQIALKKGINLEYQYGPNSTYIKGWKFDKNAIKNYIEKYANDHETPRDYAPMGGKVLVGGLEAAFEVITEHCGHCEMGIDEEAPANSVAGGNVNLDPFVKKKRKNAKVETEMFGGQKVFVVSPDRYFQSRLGKSRYARYEKYVGNDKLGEAIRQYGRNNPKNSIILKNSGNGAMLYLKYGRN